MKIFNTDQIRAWDIYTIENEPVASVELMNRAAKAFTEWFVSKYPKTGRPILILAGTGNNGGDGLAVARLLHWQMFDVKILVCDFSGKRSADFVSQLKVIPKDIETLVLKHPNDVKNALAHNKIPGDAVIIEALFGSGLKKPLEGDWAQVVDLLNNVPNEIASIDIPGGLFTDVHTPDVTVVRASRTFSFETPKRAFFFPENAGRVGMWDFGSIGLHLGYYTKTETPFHYLTKRQAALLVHARDKFSHKGTYGHALLVTGSYGKMGAAVLAAQACLRAGAGLLTVHAPRCGFLVLQTVVPEAMFSADQRATKWTKVPDLQPYSAIGAGCGIGQAPETATALENLLKTLSSASQGKNLVLDADALNLLAQNPGWWRHIPRNSILTPHPKEFERLFGKAANDFERNDLQRLKAQEHGVFIILKGAHTSIACPDGSCWFNSTGNPGMATGGSGDVLTGILTGLLARGYSPHDAALLGVCLHGLAGDLAAEEIGEEALTAGDLTAFLGKAWVSLGVGRWA